MMTSMVFLNDGKRSRRRNNQGSGWRPKARERRSPRDTYRQRRVIVWDAFSMGFILHASVHEVHHSVWNTKWVRKELRPRTWPNNRRWRLLFVPNIIDLLRLAKHLYPSSSGVDVRCPYRKSNSKKSRNCRRRRYTVVELLSAARSNARNTCC